MRKFISLPAVLLAICLFFTVAGVRAEETADPQSYWSEDSQLTYHLHSGYGFPKAIVSTIGKMIGNNDDVSVCLFLGKSKGLDPRIIMGMRNKGFSWAQTMESSGFEAYLLFDKIGIIDANGVPPKFRKAFKKYDKWKEDGGKLEMEDQEVRDLVQMRFCVNTFGVPISQVLKAGSRNNWTHVILNQGRP